jgi:predicted nuclease of predicted toxin-antitoxin system
MKLLLDSCVWGKAAEELRGIGHIVSLVEDWPSDPGDEIILAEAAADGRIIVTLDKDFGTLAVACDRAHAGIIRLVNLSARQQAAYCARVLQQFSAELEAGAIVTVEPGRVRIRV